MWRFKLDLIPNWKPHCSHANRFGAFEVGLRRYRMSMRLRGACCRDEFDECDECDHGEPMRSIAHRPRMENATFLFE